MPAEEPGTPLEPPGNRGLDGWSPSTESGLQACYGKSPGNGAFSMDPIRRRLVRLTPRRADCGLRGTARRGRRRGLGTCAGDEPLRKTRRYQGCRAVRLRPGPSPGESARRMKPAQGDQRQASKSQPNTARAGPRRWRALRPRRCPGAWGPSRNFQGRDQRDAGNADHPERNRSRANEPGSWIGECKRGLAGRVSRGAGVVEIGPGLWRGRGGMGVDSPTGSVIGGFRVGELLARGAMGAVYLARGRATAGGSR